MKKISLYIFAGIVVFTLFVGVAPRFLFFTGAQKAATEQISRILNSEITVGSMHWSWLPLPHISLVNAYITNEYSRCSLPHVNIYPNWLMIFRKGFIPGKIKLEDPDIFITETTSHTGSGSAEGTSLPLLNVSMKNGRLKIATPARYRDVLRDDHILFNNINGSLKIVPQQARIKLKASSPYSRSLDLQGHFNAEGDYMLVADCRDLDLQSLVKSFFEGRLIPASSTSRLSVTVTGKGLQDMEASLKGVLPDFFVKLKGHEVLLRNNNADLVFLKSGPLLRFTFNEIEMREPGLRLSGMVERKPAAINPGVEPSEITTAPVWTLDLTGTDLDLSAIRTKVLSLWGENKTARTVCNIVRGGKAASGAYHFSGEYADFWNLDTMTIEAVALEADIHVPGAELDLTRASGPIMIKNSFLSGSGLSASLGKSRGSNGNILLDLSRRTSAFSLDVDIDADLVDLPPVLEQLVHHDGFQQELHKFKNVSGKASANLKLGNSLHNIITQVNVRDMHFSTSYNLLPQTVFIEKGTLQVAPEEVSWQKVQGRAGLQQIKSTSGSVSWHTGNVMLHIEELEGQLDGFSLLEVLRQRGSIRNKIDKELTSLSGNIGVSGSTLRGPAAQPEAWEYLLTVTSNDLSFTSPLLPEPVRSGKLSAILSDRAINIEKAEINFLDQPIALEGTLTHKVLGNWQGMLEFNGTVQQKLADWLGSKRWLSEKLRPNIPCRVEKLVVQFHGETTAVSGFILPGLSDTRLPMARIVLENTPEYLRINELTFYAPGEQGSLGLAFQRQAPHRLVLSWNGFVSAETIDALFQRSAFTSGTFSGAFFEVSYFPGQPGATRYKGLLKGDNLLLKYNDDVPIIIRNIVMNGVDKQLRISTLDFAIGTESITGMGKVTSEEKGLLLDIDLASSHLSSNFIDRLSRAARQKQNILFSSSEEGEYGMLTYKDWDITGHIGFRFESYSYNRSISTPYSETKPFTYTLYDVLGDLQLAPDSLIRTEIFSSKLCGLDFNGFWHSDGEFPQNFQVNTPSEGKFRLEEVLPCLGVEQDLFEGKFSLQANLQKDSGVWDRGNIYLKSTQGRILRLQTLSRIFKVVNITDLFQEQVGDAGKKGFPFTQMDIDTHLDANNLILDRAIIRGEGLNLFCHGKIHMADYDADLTLLIAPLKTFDTMISKVPVIGNPVMDRYESVVTIPVAIKGPIADPIITPLHPSAVGGQILNLVKDTLLMPFSILRQD
jgi:hypothetical protein